MMEVVSISFSCSCNERKKGKYTWKQSHYEIMCTIAFFCITYIVASQICFVHDGHNLTNNTLHKKQK